VIPHVKRLQGCGLLRNRLDPLAREGLHQAYTVERY
jgi:hypothetical protein